MPADAGEVGRGGAGIKCEYLHFTTSSKIESTSDTVREISKSLSAYIPPALPILSRLEESLDRPSMASAIASRFTGLRGYCKRLKHVAIFSAARPLETHEQSLVLLRQTTSPGSVHPVQRCQTKKQQPPIEMPAGGSETPQNVRQEGSPRREKHHQRDTMKFAFHPGKPPSQGKRWQ